MKYIFWILWAIVVLPILKLLLFGIMSGNPSNTPEGTFLAMLVYLLIGALVTTYVLLLEFLFSKWRKPRSPYKLAILSGTAIIILPWLNQGLRALIDVVFY